MLQLSRQFSLDSHCLVVEDSLAVCFVAVVVAVAVVHAVAVVDVVFLPYLGLKCLPSLE
jgi:hypothetical protein